MSYKNPKTYTIIKQATSTITEPYCKENVQVIKKEKKLGKKRKKLKGKKKTIIIIPISFSI